MDQYHQQQTVSPMSITNASEFFLLSSAGNGSPKSPPSPSFWFEIRLFYVRISPCAVDCVPELLSLRKIRNELGVCLEINGSRFLASETASLTLRRDRVDREAAEVTYVGTDIIRISRCVEFEVYEMENLLLCGSIQRLDCEWSMECYTPASTITSAFFQPKLGISSPSIEVYVAGRCADVPVIFTKMINISPRRKPHRHWTLDAIPEVDETGKDRKFGNALIRHLKLQLNETGYEYEAVGKNAHNWHPEGVYEGEDGQITLFNAGVRVGVGIGLGMCLGIGIGVGLLMHSYQTTTKRFRRFL